MRVVLIQCSPHWEDPVASREHADTLLNQIRGKVDLILLPEMFTTGFSMNASALAESDEHAPTLEWMRTRAKKLDAVICGSIIFRDPEGHFRNRLFWVQPDGTVYTYDKRHLFVLTEEPRIYRAGTRRVVVSWRGWRFFLSICFDLRFPLWYWLPGMYDGIVVVASWPHRRIHAWRSLLIARAIENQAYVLAVNRVGTDPYETYSGHSMIVDYAGRILVEKSGEPTLLEGTLERDGLQTFRKKYPFASSGDAHPVLLGDILTCSSSSFSG